jgi:hypothetical protein
MLRFKWRVCDGNALRARQFPRFLLRNILCFGSHLRLLVISDFKTQTGVKTREHLQKPSNQEVHLQDRCRPKQSSPPFRSPATAKNRHQQAIQKRRD